MKDHLSAYLHEASSGELIVVTDRGEPVAEITPPGSASVGANPAVALAREGRATIGAKNDPSLYPLLKPLLPPGRAMALLDEERGER